jgi:hypothetical protein
MTGLLEMKLKRNEFTKVFSQPTQSSENSIPQCCRVKVIAHMQSKWLQWRQPIFWNQPAPLRVIGLVIIRNTGVHGSS